MKNNFINPKAMKEIEKKISICPTTQKECEQHYLQCNTTCYLTQPKILLASDENTFISKKQAESEKLKFAIEQLNEIEEQNG